MSAESDRKTRVCVLTPDSRGAIAVARVWGPDAVALVSSVFRPARGASLKDTAPGRIRFGRLGANAGDEVVTTITDDDPPEVEIHGHGGPGAVALVVDALIAAGAERRRPVAWVRHVSRSIVEAEALVDLTRAPTVRTAEIFLDQWHGALERDLAIVPAAMMRRRASVGMRLISGWKMALAGRPNVGKSHLLNALAGYSRAIVDPTPGTTRDIVTVRTSFDGWPVEMADTAGLRASTDPIEAEGVRRALCRQAASDLVLLVLDLSQPLTENDRQLIATSPDALIVANKSDLAPAWPAEGLVATTVSAERGDGLDQLIASIVSRIVPEPPEPGAGVPFRPRHLRLIEAME